MHHLGPSRDKVVNKLLHRIIRPILLIHLNIKYITYRARCQLSISHTIINKVIQMSLIKLLSKDISIDQNNLRTAL